MATFLKTKWKWVLLLCILVGFIFFLVYQYNSRIWIQVIKLYDLYQNHQEFKKTISSYGAYAPLAYILLQVLQIIIAPIPGGAVEFLGGVLFGVKAGFIYSMIGLTLGSWLAFSLARSPSMSQVSFQQ